MALVRRMTINAPLKPPTTLYLTKTERTLLKWAAQGYTPKMICAQMKKTPAAFRVCSYRVRQKTGLVSLADSTKCAAALQRATSILTHITSPRSPSERQMAVLRGLVAGKTYATICRQLKISMPTAHNASSQGCKRLGIRGTDRLTQLRVTFAAIDAENDPMNDPMFR